MAEGPGMTQPTPTFAELRAAMDSLADLPEPPPFIELRPLQLRRLAEQCAPEKVEPWRVGHGGMALTGVPIRLVPAKGYPLTITPRARKARR